jgi:long-subunit fatty acid transport protein
VNSPDIKIVGKRVAVELMYPGVGDNPDQVEINMCHVRATDGLLINYDFDRNGWSIKQASTFSWAARDGD